MINIIGLGFWENSDYVVNNGNIRVKEMYFVFYMFI